MRAQLLQGFLLRLARARDSAAFALRGGMLVHQWMPEARRPVGDIDLVCGLPLDPRDLRARLHAVLACEVADGVVFDAERFRLDRIPAGLKLYAAGDVDGRPAEIAVDLAFGIDVWPAVRRQPLIAERGTAALGMCAHEMVIATKLAVTAEGGVRGWRPKDIADIWLALRRFAPGSLTVVGEALERRLGRADAGVAVLAAPWWHDMRAAMRWARHVSRRRLVPGVLEVALAEIRAALAPLARTA